MTVGSQVKTVLASLKNMEATLDILSQKTQDPEAMQIYQQTKDTIDEVIIDMHEQIQVLQNEEPQYDT